MAETLLADVKNYLNITWEDPEGDKKLSGILARGKRRIDRVAGSPQDYSEEAAPRELLFEYCRYAREEALDEWERNYLPELVELQIDCQVDRMDENGGSEGGGNEGGEEVTNSDIMYVFYKGANDVGGFSEDGQTLSFVGGAVEYYVLGGAHKVVTLPAATLPYAHAQYILFDTDSPGNPISTNATWPEKGVVKVCGYMHNNGSRKVVEVFGMGTQVWQP